MLLIGNTPGFGASCVDEHAFVFMPPFSTGFDVGFGAGFGAGFNIGIEYPVQTKPPRVQFLHLGLASSHFFLRRLHVSQPVLVL
jgi:hypothetical protein